MTNKPHVARLRFAFVLLITYAIIVVGCSRLSHDGDRRDTGSFFAEGEGGVVVTQDSLATEAALAVLRDGGNAVDAAVAAAFVLAVTYPEAGNIGGGGFMVVRDSSGGNIWCLDFRERAPGAASTNMYVDLDSAGVQEPSLLGPTAAGIPGTPAGLHAAWKRSGTRPWGELLEPAIAIARRGFVVSVPLGKSFEEKAEGLGRYQSTRDIFFRGDHVVRAGDTVIQNDLANTLESLATQGPEAFYQGSGADLLVGGVRSGGGIWSAEDLHGYRAVFREPVRFTLDAEDDVEIYTMPLPASGGLVLAQALAFMRAQKALSLAADSPARATAMVESFRLAFADRNTKLGDPDFSSTPIDSLISVDYMNQLSAKLPPRPPGKSSALGPSVAPVESDNTTHVVVMDDNGGVVSLTYTLNSLFGCKWVAPGTGVLLNNEMDDFETRPGQPNIYGLVGTGINIVRPGARMLSSMSPTIVMRGGDVWFALGGRGGPRIATAVFQVIFSRCVDGIGMADAVARPRVHQQWFPDVVYLDEDRQFPGMFQSLVDIGYKVETKPSLGRVIAAEYLGEGRYVGVLDPRASGYAKTVH